MQSAALDAYVFLFSFSCMFLLVRRGPLLKLSTRLTLIVLIALAGAYGLFPDLPYRAALGAATVIANVLFVAFAAIDVVSALRSR